MEENQPIGCRESDQRMRGFLEICLLVLLQNEAKHGYGLMEQLVPFGFSKENLPVGTLYRTLRKMEKDEFVTSVWESSGQGPKRRMYCLSAIGKAHLQQRIEFLKYRRKLIDKLISRYNLDSKG